MKVWGWAAFIRFCPAYCADSVVWMTVLKLHHPKNTGRSENRTVEWWLKQQCSAQRPDFCSKVLFVKKLMGGSWYSFSFKCVIEWYLSLLENSLSYFQFGLPRVMASVLHSHLHVIPGLISIALIWKHYQGKKKLRPFLSFSSFICILKRNFCIWKKIESLFQEHAEHLLQWCFLSLTTDCCVYRWCSSCRELWLYQQWLQCLWRREWQVNRKSAYKSQCH